MKDDVAAVLRAGVEHVELVAALFDEYRQFYGQPPDIAQARQFVGERLQNEESVIFLALKGAAAVGFTQLYPSFSSVALRRLWILNDLYVAPAARGQRVGEALLERAKHFAAETGAKGLTLETAIDNPARALYERVGWKPDEAFCHYSLNV